MTGRPDLYGRPVSERSQRTTVLAEGSLAEVRAMLPDLLKVRSWQRDPKAYALMGKPLHALLDNPGWRSDDGEGPGPASAPGGLSIEEGPGDAGAGWVDALRTLLTVWGPTVTDANADTLLHTAARHGSVRAVVALLAAGADPRARNALDVTPLHAASRALHDGVVRALLKHGVPVDLRQQNDVRGTPLMEALRAEAPVVDAGMNTSRPSGDTGVLDHRVERFMARRRAVVRTLLEAGANPQERDHQGVDLLSRAVLDSVTPMEDVIGDLVAAGADPAVRNRQGETLDTLLREEIEHLEDLAATVPLPSTLARLRVHHAHRDAWRAAMVAYEQKVLSRAMTDTLAKCPPASTTDVPCKPIEAPVSPSPTDVQRRRL